MTSKRFLLDSYSIPFPPGYPKNRRIIAVLAKAEFQGYFDESGKDHDSKVVAIAGCVSTPLKWNRFSKEWSSVLKKYGITAFHATDCANGHDEFKNLTKEERDKLVIELTPLIIKHVYFGVCVAVLVDQYKEMMKGRSKDCFPLINDPYYYCVFTCIYGNLDEQMQKRTYQNDKVALVFHENRETQSLTTRAYEMQKNITPNNNRVISLTYASHKDYMPLQAADFMAYESRKELHRQHYDSQRSRRKCLEVVLASRKFTAISPNKEALIRHVETLKKFNAF